MILNSVAPPTNLNPFNISGQQGSWAAEIVWDRLMRVDPEGLPKPWAAEKVERPDATTVNVTLRKGMKWSDGQPVTIEDAVFSLVAPGYGDKAPMYKPFVTQHRQRRGDRPRHAHHQAEAARRGIPGQLAVEAEPGAEACLATDLR